MRRSPSWRQSPARAHSTRPEPRWIDTQQRRFAAFGTSVFAEMSRLAVEHQAVNLGQGFPDFAGTGLRQGGGQARRSTPTSTSTRSRTAPRVCGTAIAADWARDSAARSIRIAKSPSPVGATEGDLRRDAGVHRSRRRSRLLRAVLRLLPDRDDAWPAATFRPVRLHPPDWSFDLDELRAAFTPRTRGAAAQHAAQPDRQGLHPRRARADRRTLPGARCRRLTDEVYDRIVFDGATTSRSRRCRACGSGR